MKSFYSVKKSTFYIDSVHKDTIPADAIEISTQKHKELIDGLSDGKLISLNSAGELILMESPKTTKSELLAPSKTALRAIRAPMLDALSGIAGRAMRSGNSELASEADALAEKLLDITDDIELNASETHEEMQDSGAAALKRIADSASDELAIVFREITALDFLRITSVP